MADIQQAVALNACGTTIATAKHEFEARLKFLEKNIYTAITNGSIQSVDYDMYAVRHLQSDTTIELMQSADSKLVGITNVNDRKLEANTYFFLTGIQLLAATVEANTEANLKTAQWDVIPALLGNGEFELKNGDKVLIPRISCQRFVTTDSDSLKGYIKLEAPKMILPMTDIIPQLFLPQATNGKVAVKLVFHGVKTNRA